MCHIQGTSLLAGWKTWLPVPSRPWYHIAIDFITDLPKVSKGHTIIMIITDWGMTPCASIPPLTGGWLHVQAFLCIPKVTVPRLLISYTCALFPPPPTIPIWTLCFHHKIGWKKKNGWAYRCVIVSYLYRNVKLTHSRSGMPHHKVILSFYVLLRAWLISDTLWNCVNCVCVCVYQYQLRAQCLLRNLTIQNMILLHGFDNSSHTEIFGHKQTKLFIC